MSETARAAAGVDERSLVESLRARYEAKGFAFVVEPAPSTLPEFMGDYRPDAVARKPGRNIAIEVKGRQTSTVLASLQKIRRLFEGQADWQLDIVFAGEPSMMVPVSSADTILDHKREVVALSADGHRRAAFVMAWSLLEGALHSIRIAENKARSVEGVLEALAGEGYVEPDMERRLRPLVALRNRIVHGDVIAEPTDQDIALVLAAIDQTLLADAA